MESADLATVKVSYQPARVEPSPPEHLVGEGVAEPGDDRLVEEGGFDGSPSSVQLLHELVQREPGGVGTLRRDDPIDVSVVDGEPRTTQLADVSQPDLVTISEHEAIGAAAGFSVLDAHETSGHAEVDDQRSIARDPHDQPLATPRDRPDLTPAEHTLESLRGAALQHRRVDDFDACDPPKVPRQQPPVAGDVGKLWHALVAARTLR